MIFFRFIGMFTDFYGGLLAYNVVPLIHSVLLDTWMIMLLLFHVHIAIPSMCSNMTHSGNRDIV